MKQSQKSDKEEDIRRRIRTFSTNIQKLQLDISSYQDLISDLYSDLQMLEAQKGSLDALKKEEEDREE